jgi:type I site-specific restriction-modification system R (restriction) subunit
VNKEIINALLERAEEMLDKNYSRKIGAEEIITILREYERLQKENEELKGDLERDIYARDCLAKHSISKDKIRNKIIELEEDKEENLQAIQELKILLEGN